MVDPPGIPSKNRLPKIEHGSPSLRPSHDTVSALLRAGARWSPAGLAALLVLVFWGIGGSDGAVKIAKAWRSSSDSQMAMARELSELTREVKALRVAITGAQASQQAARVNLAAVCDLAAELNLGKPHDSWCSEDGRSIRFNGPPLGTTAPLHVTAFTWQKVPQ
jgi:hypothetical protein